MIFFVRERSHESSLWTNKSILWLFSWFYDLGVCFPRNLTASETSLITNQVFLAKKVRNSCYVKLLTLYMCKKAKPQIFAICLYGVLTASFQNPSSLGTCIKALLLSISKRLGCSPAVQGARPHVPNHA